MKIRPKCSRSAVAAVMLSMALVGSLQAAGPGPTGAGPGGGTGAGGGPTIQADATVPGEILVKLRTTSALAPLLSKYAVTLVDRFGARPIYRLKVIGNASAKDILAGLTLEPDVMIAEANSIHQSPEARKNVAWAIGTPQDYVAQWAPQAMHLAEAQRIATGSGVRVAVLDTGVDATHPLLSGRLAPGFDFVDFDNDPSEVGSPANAGFGHGTHVAGLVAMAAPAATIIALRVLDADGVGNVWVLSEALLYAIDPDGDPNTDDGAQVINMSLGTMARTRILDAVAQIAACEPAIDDDPVADRSDPGYNDDAIRCSRSAGAVVVAAAGNDASGSVKEYPAAESAKGLLSIAASKSDSTLAAFSNFGAWINVAAPGDGITSSIPGGGYATWSGTSMAAPLVAGTAALLRSLNPNLRPQDVVQRIRNSSALMCGTSLRQVDAAAALTNIAPPAINCR